MKTPASLRIYQALLFLLAAVPCGIPFRYPPNPVFPSELAAFGFCALLIMAAAALPNTLRRSAPPWMSWPWLALAAVLLIQIVALPVIYWSERTIPLSYLITAGLAVWSLSLARDEHGIEPLAVALAWGLLVGALFNTGISVPQIVQLLEHGPRLIFGNIGQKNMYGHYLAWGLAAAAWLTAHHRLQSWAFWILAAWLALSMAWCGSRSIFLYAGAWLVFGGVLFFTTHGKNRRFAGFLFGAAVLILAMQFVAPLINEVMQASLHAKNEVPTGLDRLDSNGARRLVEWHKAWMVFLEHPVLGVGWGGYGAESVRLQVIPAFAKVVEPVLFTHCHNSLLNLMAETGVIGTVVVVVPLLLAFAALWGRRQDTVAVFGASLVIVSILHSLVEYPLWYFHFFGPFALMLYLMFDNAPKGGLSMVQARMGGMLTGLAALALGIAGTAFYIQLYPIMDSSSKPKENERRIHILEQMRHNPLLDYFAEFGLSNFIVANRDDIAWKLGVVAQLDRIHPYPGQLSDEAIMRALLGDQAKAHERIRQAIYSFPDSLGYYRHEIERFPHEPAVQALLVDVEAGEKMYGKQAYDPNDDSDDD